MSIWPRRTHTRGRRGNRGEVRAPVSLLLAWLTACCCASGRAGSAPTAADDATPSSPSPALTPPAAVLAQSGAPTQASFRNVAFHVAPGVVLRIQHLRGELTSKRQGQPVVFDDKRSFILHIDTATVGLDTNSLDHLMNEHVFAYPGAPLKRLKFATTGGQLVLRGTLHKVVDIPFEITATPSITQAGLIRVHPTAIRIFSIDGEGLLKALDISLSKLLDVKRARGVTVSGNDLLLDPLVVLPPPAIQGRVVAIRVVGDVLEQTFGGTHGRQPAARLSPPDATASNYMYFAGGTLRFGKLFMVRADMQIVDENPRDPFDFSIDEYNRQLVAGYSKNLPNFGLEVFMPDLSKAPALARRRGASSLRRDELAPAQHR